MANTRLTLELPAAAAAKLAAMTPEQLAELSALIGHEIKSVTIEPSEATRRERVNTAFAALSLYSESVPWARIDEILSQHDFSPIAAENALYNFRVNDKYQPYTHVQVGPKTWLFVTWYRMPSGSYEVTAYVS